jgi:hypothetical protein
MLTSHRFMSITKSPQAAVEELEPQLEHSSGLRTSPTSVPSVSPPGPSFSLQPVPAAAGATVSASQVAIRPVAVAAADPDGGDPEWRMLAYSLMTEGVGLLERLCVLSETAERRCLLGSAYKRQAWIGLGESRQSDLATAAQAYAEAHRLDLGEGDQMDGAHHIPSPYARLNQVTLELLAGTGKPAEKTRLLVMVKQANEVGRRSARARAFADAWTFACVCARVCVRACVVCVMLACCTMCSSGRFKSENCNRKMCGFGYRVWTRCVCVTCWVTLKCLRELS